MSFNDDEPRPRTFGDDLEEFQQALRGVGRAILSAFEPVTAPLQAAIDRAVHWLMNPWNERRFRR